MNETKTPPTVESITEGQLKTEVLAPEGGAISTALDYKTQHRQALDELAREVEALPKEVKTEQDRDVLMAMKRKLVSKRTGIDKARKRITEPFTKITGEVNAYLGTGAQSGLQSEIAALEAKVEAPVKVYDDNLARIQREKEEAVQRRTVQRTTDLLNQKVERGEGFYHLGPAKVYDADIATMADETWETIMNTVRNVRAQLDKEKQDAIDKEQQKKEEQDRLLAEARKEILASRHEWLMDQGAELKINEFGGTYVTNGIGDTISFPDQAVAAMPTEEWERVKDTVRKANEWHKDQAIAKGILQSLPEQAVEYPDGAHGFGAHSETLGELVKRHKEGTFDKWLEQLKQVIKDHQESERITKEAAQREKDRLDALTKERGETLMRIGSGYNPVLERFVVGMASIPREMLAKMSEEQFDATKAVFAEEVEVERARVIENALKEKREKENSMTDAEHLGVLRSSMDNTLAQVDRTLELVKTATAQHGLEMVQRHLKELVTTIDKIIKDLP